MWRWLLVRLLWFAATLLGVSFVTFVVLDRAPVDRARLEVLRAHSQQAYSDTAARDEAVQRLRVRYGLVDAQTHEPLPLWRRYAAWLGRLSALRLAGPGEDDAALWRRLGQALPMTMLLGGLALIVAIGAGVPIGVWLGRRAGGRRERIASTVLLLLVGVPEFLLATLLLLGLSVGGLPLFPASGFASNGADSWSWFARLLDAAHHLLLPVLVMSTGPMVMVTRFVRDAVARAAAAPFATGLRALGIPGAVVRRRLLRHGAVPVATLLGGLLPMLVGGSIVVENLFALDGLGHLAFQAVLDQDQALVLVLVLLTSSVTLVSLLISDAVHRLVDARVRLVA